MFQHYIKAQTAVDAREGVLREMPLPVRGFVQLVFNGLEITWHPIFRIPLYTAWNASELDFCTHNALTSKGSQDIRRNHHPQNKMKLYRKQVTKHLE